MLMRIFSVLLLSTAVLKGPGFGAGVDEVKEGSLKGNAAPLYLEAIEHLHYPDGTPLEEKIDKACQGAWQEEWKDLEAVLQKNEKAFALFREALPLPSCDFTLGKKVENLVLQEPAPLIELYQVIKLLRVKGRYHEGQEAFGKAMEVQTGLLRFSGHVAQNFGIIYKSVALDVQQAAYTALRGMVGRDLLEKKHTGEIRTLLETSEKDRFTLAQMMEEEKAFYLASVEMLGDMLVSQVQKEDALHARVKKLKDALREHARHISDHVYDEALSAAESRDEAGWERFEEELKSMKHDFTFKAIEKYINQEQEVLRPWPETETEKIAKTLAGITMIISFPNFKPLVDRYHATQKELEDLKRILELKMG
jgi:hypothetical protein